VNGDASSLLAIKFAYLVQMSQTVRKIEAVLLSNMIAADLRWIKMKLGNLHANLPCQLGMEVGLGPGHIVLDGDPAPPGKGHSSPLFSAHVYCTARRPPISATAEQLLKYGLVIFSNMAAVDIWDFESGAF